MSDHPVSPVSPDGIDRRGFLKCMAWAGTGLVWTVSSGVLSSRAFAADPAAPVTAPAVGEFTFVQLSDSHIGFSKPINKDVTATLQQAVDRINALPAPPGLLIHSGDLTHLAKPDEFDAVAQILKGVKTDSAFFVPGEHDFYTDEGKSYLARYGKETHGSGWHSFNKNGVHFVGLVNVMNLKAAGLGVLGQEQLDWLKADLAGLGNSTPIVVFAHVPLWTVYQEWGWGTQDAEQALDLLKRFGSVTVLNGHIHQIFQKVEGQVSFHTARSTAFPQGEPGKAASAGPLNVGAEKLRSMLGVASISVHQGTEALMIQDKSLA